MCDDEAADDAICVSPMYAGAPPDVWDRPLGSDSARSGRAADHELITNTLACKGLMKGESTPQRVFATKCSRDP